MHASATPAAALIFNFLRIIADNGRPAAYSELVRVVTRGGLEEADGILDKKIRMILRDASATVQASRFSAAQYRSWRPLIRAYLKFVTGLTLNAQSPSSQQGNRLNYVIKGATGAFKCELEIAGDPVAAHSIVDARAMTWGGKFSSEW